MERDSKTIFVMEEKEPYWLKWLARSIVPFTSLDSQTKSRMVECEKSNSISKSAEFRIVEYVRLEKP